MTRLVTGSTQCQPVRRIIIPAMTTPAETAASDAMCRNAPLILRSVFCPRTKSNAVTPLITIPNAATKFAGSGGPSECECSVDGIARKIPRFAQRQQESRTPRLTFANTRPDHSVTRNHDQQDAEGADNRCSRRQISPKGEKQTGDSANQRDDPADQQPVADPLSEINSA